MLIFSHFILLNDLTSWDDRAIKQRVAHLILTWHNFVRQIIFSNLGVTYDSGENPIVKLRFKNENNNSF